MNGENCVCRDAKLFQRHEWRTEVSRGLGRIQKQLLTVLRVHAATSPRSRARGLDTIELAQRVYHHFPAPKFHKLTKPRQEVAVRRALASLARKRLVRRLGMRASGPYRIRRCHWRATG
jgi:hypothetical protein